MLPDIKAALFNAIGMRKSMHYAAFSEDGGREVNVRVAGSQAGVEGVNRLKSGVVELARKFPVLSSWRLSKDFGDSGVIDTDLKLVRQIRAQVYLIVRSGKYER